MHGSRSTAQQYEGERTLPNKEMNTNTPNSLVGNFPVPLDPLMQ